LVARAAGGDVAALEAVLARYRPRLRRMVMLRLDRRLATRVDESDVVQEALAQASQQIGEYARTQPVPFYPWLRAIAWNRLLDLHRRHILAQRRSVRREQGWAPGLPDESLSQLADHLAASGTQPSGRLRRLEQNARVRAAVAQLADNDREVLTLRYLEQLSSAEAAAVLGISGDALLKRQVRALKRLRGLLDDLTGPGDTGRH
jgi:RNA polymerase sigma-70 factor (ECF subfamily)